MGNAFPSRWGQLLDEVWTFVRGSGTDVGRTVMLYKGDARPQVEVGVELHGPFAAALLRESRAA